MVCLQRAGAALRSFLCICLIGLGAPEAARANERVNPCAYGGFDQPCQVPGGTYRALKPKGNGPFPTVVYLHGSGGRSSEVASSSYFQRMIVDRGYVLIAPTALDAVNYVTGRDTGWSLRARKEHPRDDVAFLRRVLDHAQDRFRIDRRRVIFVGQSDGGFLIWEIACHEPRLGAAYAVHAGSYGGPLPQSCSEPVHFMQVHGRADRVVPFEAERMSPSGRRLSAANPLDGLALLARTNRCRREGDLERRAVDGFDRRSWIGCAREGRLDYLIHNGGHSYPRRFMKTVLDWFEALPLAAPGVGTTAFHKAGSRNNTGSRFKSVKKPAAE